MNGVDIDSVQIISQGSHTLEVFTDFSKYPDIRYKMDCCKFLPSGIEYAIIRRILNRKKDGRK
jgi:hypothetical protein